MKKAVKVYDNIKKELVDVEVSDEVYTYFNRTKWNIHDNNETFYKHEIQFSQLLDTIDFQSLIDGYTEDRAITNVMIEKLIDCLKRLSKDDYNLIYLLFYECKNEQECAELLNTTQQNISKKKKRILCKLYKLLKM